MIIVAGQAGANDSATGEVDLAGVESRDWRSRATAAPDVVGRQGLRAVGRKRTSRGAPAEISSPPRRKGCVASSWMTHVTEDG